MKLQIYGTNEPEQEPVRLRLVEVGSSIYVSAVHKDGIPNCGGALIEFLPDGSFRRPTGVDETLGFQIDESGRIWEKR